MSLLLSVSCLTLLRFAHFLLTEPQPSAVLSARALYRNSPSLCPQFPFPPSALLNNSIVECRHFKCPVWAKMPIPLAFLAPDTLSLRKKYERGKTVFWLNLHFFFIISKTEHLFRFVSHLYFLSMSLTCC